MSTDNLLQQIKALLKPLQEGQASLESGQKQMLARLDTLEEGQSRANTAIESLAAGQADIKDELAAVRIDIHDLKSSLTKKIKSNERRINTLEDELDIPHPNKN
mgnify:CR=1 FL=1